MSRQGGGAGGSGGGVGTRGPGETKIETDRRRIRERMSKLRREIKDMKKIRDTQRGRRLPSDAASVAIVGYTNAGKSSLLNALTGAGVLVENALFATLEPTTRRGRFRRRHGRSCSPTPSGSCGTCPPSWSRRSARRWRRSSTPICWCTSSTVPTPTRWRRSTPSARWSTRSIAEYDVAPPPELLVVNKIDAAGGLALAQLRRALPDAVFVSAHTGDGLDRLRSRMAELVEPTDTTVDVTIPYDRGDLVARMHADGRVDATEHTGAGDTDQGPRARRVGRRALREFATF